MFRDGRRTAPYPAPRAPGGAKTGPRGGQNRHLPWLRGRAERVCCARSAPPAGAPGANGHRKAKGLPPNRGERVHPGRRPHARRHPILGSSHARRAGGGDRRRLHVGGSGERSRHSPTAIGVPAGSVTPSMTDSAARVPERSRSVGKFGGFKEPCAHQAVVGPARTKTVSPIGVRAHVSDWSTTVAQG